MKRTLIASMLVILMAAVTAWGQVPQTMSYQGVLTDGAGTPVTDGNYDLTFKLYSVASGGTEFWSETQTVAVSGGIFNVILGSVTPITGLFNMQYYLGVTVGAGTEMTPRTQLAGTPYSMSSRGLSGVDNYMPASGNVGIGTLSPGEKLTVFGNSGGSRFVNFERTDNLAASNDLLQLVIGAGSSPDCQYIECENGGTVFQVYGDGYVNAAGGVRLGNTSRTTAGNLRWTGSDFEGYNGSSWLSLTASGGSLPSGTSGQTMRHDGSSWVASSLLTNDGTTIGIGTPSLNGELHLYRSGVATEMANLYTTAQGGWLIMKDEADNSIAELGPSGNGTGGYLRVDRPGGLLGFVVNANWLGSGDAGMNLAGASRSAAFRMDLSGDSSVDLPTGAISAPEMLNEPGVASAAEGVSYVQLSGPVEVLLQRTINVPSSGYVLVLGTVQTIIDHTTGSYSSANFGVSDVAGSLPANQDVTCWIGGAAPTDQYDIPVSPHGLFEVAAAAAYTFYLLGDLVSGTIGAYDMQLTLVYLPTPYGSVQPTVAGDVSVPDEQAIRRSPLSPQEMKAERMDSQAFNQARIESELAEMQVKLDALKQQLADERRGK
jgi:hypothetical protein